MKYRNRIDDNAGALDERIIVRRESLVNDGMGGSAVSVSDLGTFYANVTAMSGRERDMANQTENPRNYRFKVRRSSATAAILESDKIVWRNKTMNIRFIADEGLREKYMEIEAEYGVAT
jgi:SPP1 family predicted phage head-tail adaptor